MKLVLALIVILSTSLTIEAAAPKAHKSHKDLRNLSASRLFELNCKRMSKKDRDKLRKSVDIFVENLAHYAVVKNYSEDMFAWERELKLNVVSAVRRSGFGLSVGVNRK